MIVAPGVTACGSSSGALVESVDLFPTLAELAYLPAPTGPQPIDGESLVPILRCPAATVRNHAYHSYPRGGRLGRAIRTDRYRLVEWKPFDGDDAPEYELYDYYEDPLETMNLAQERPGVVRELVGILQTHPTPLPPQR